MEGVYVITNETTGEQYVGASWDIGLRLRSHRSQLRGGKHPNKRMQAGWNAAGEDAFSFEGLEAVPETVKDGERHIWVSNSEARWIFRLNPAYNRLRPHVDDEIKMRVS